jgi:hypothetical protein
MEVPTDVDLHWLFEADGYGVQHEYVGWRIFEEGGTIVLVPGTDRRIRVLAPFGGPLAGARVEMFMGCSHSPAVRVATTDEEGIATLPNVSDSGWDFWIAAPGVDPGPYSLPAGPSPGAPPVVITDWGAVAKGTVVDEAGEPVAGAVVRELDGFRGPVTVTGPAGAFTLHGAREKQEIGVFVPGSPFAPRPDAVARGFAEGVPLRIALRKDRPVALGEGEPRHRLDVVIEKGDSFVPLEMVRLSDGLTLRRQSGFYATGFDVPPGDWRITAGGGFSFESERTVIATVPSPGDAPVRITLEVSQAGFGVRHGPGRHKDEAELRIPGWTKDVKLNQIVWIPREGPASLLVEEPFPRLLPVPPLEGDNRFLDLPEPEPVQVRFRLMDPEGKALTPDMEAEVETDEEGVSVMRLFESDEITFAAEGHCDRGIEVCLPPPPATVDLGTIVLRPESDFITRTLTTLSAEGEAVPIEAIHIGADEWGTDEVECFDGDRVAIQPEGYFPMPVTITKDGPSEFRMPAGRIEVEVPKQGNSTAWLDGWPFEDEDGKIVIRGVPPGQHRLIVVTPGKPLRRQTVTVR